jgi:hypothetical protein
MDQLTIGAEYMVMILVLHHWTVEKGVNKVRREHVVDKVTTVLVPKGIK